MIYMVCGLTPEILFLPDEHETDIHPYRGHEETIDEQVHHQGGKRPSMIGYPFLDQLVGIDHDEEAERHQGKGYEEPGKGQGQ